MATDSTAAAAATGRTKTPMYQYVVYLCRTHSDVLGERILPTSKFTRKRARKIDIKNTPCITLTHEEREADVHPPVAAERLLKLDPESGPSAFLGGGPPHDVEVPEVAPAGRGDVPENVGPEHGHGRGVPQLYPVRL